MSMQTALIKSILENWLNYKWTKQGFGFIRTKIYDVGRIHIWDSSVMINRVSTIHTHPWAFTSTIISGELINQRYKINGVGLPYKCSRIKTGEGGGLTGEITEVNLLSDLPEIYTVGQGYGQAAHEIHRTVATDGTVTLLERQRGEPLEEADVYWPTGTDWVSAEPKPVESYQVESIIKYALLRWDA